MNGHCALVLDFGGVVTRTLFETHALTERALGLAPDTLRWRGPFDPETDALWRSMQDGDISEREYWLARAREVGRLIGEDWTSMAQLVVRARGGEPEEIIRPEARRAIADAKAAGAKLGVLSNELDLFYGAGFAKRLPLLRAFDVVCDATYSGVLKPAARAYLDCCTQLGVAPERCVFVDDQLRNVRGARDVGMHAIHFDVRAPASGFGDAVQLIHSLLAERLDA